MVQRSGSTRLVAVGVLALLLSACGGGGEDFGSSSFNPPDSPGGSPGGSGSGGGSGGGGNAPGRGTVFAEGGRRLSQIGESYTEEITVGARTTFQWHFTSDYRAQAVIMDPVHAETFRDGGTVPAYALFDNRFGHQTVTLGAGDYVIGVRNAVDGSNRFQHELDLMSQIPGWVRAETVRARVETLASGARRADPFTVRSDSRYWLDGCNSGLDTFVIPASEVDNFMGGLSFRYVVGYGSDTGDVSKYGATEVKLSAGTWYLAQRNPEDGPKTISYILERWIPVLSKPTIDRVDEQTVDEPVGAVLQLPALYTLDIVPVRSIGK